MCACGMLRGKRRNARHTVATGHPTPELLRGTQDNQPTGAPPQPPSACRRYGKVGPSGAAWQRQPLAELPASFELEFADLPAGDHSFAWRVEDGDQVVLERSMAFAAAKDLDFISFVASAGVMALLTLWFLSHLLWEKCADTNKDGIVDAAEVIAYQERVFGGKGVGGEGVVVDQRRRQGWSMSSPARLVHEAGDNPVMIV